MSVRKLAILTFQSLDGVMQAPSNPNEDKSNNFNAGGWANPYWNEVMQQVMQEAMNKNYDLLLGRKTYEIFAAHFSNAGEDNAIAQKLNKAKKHVITSSLKNSLWKNSNLIKGNIKKEIKKLKEQAGPLLQVHGSWELIQELQKHHLIDEYRIWTFPIILGNGKRLFENGIALNRLILKKSARCNNGTIMTIYKNDFSA